jgi:hypothetical protein
VSRAFMLCATRDQVNRIASSNSGIHQRRLTVPLQPVRIATGTGTGCFALDGTVYSHKSRRPKYAVIGVWSTERA